MATAVAEEPPASPTGQVALKPENEVVWHKNTERTLINSRNQVREMLTRCRQNEMEEAANRAAAEDFAKREREAAKRAVYNKAAAHGKVIDVSFKCMQDIEEVTLQMEDSATKLKHERMQGFAALQVCQRRMELRQKRPVSETFKDTLQEALEHEERVLNSAREELLKLEDVAKKIIDELVSTRRFLSMDTGERRLEMAHDMSSLKPNFAVPPSGSMSNREHAPSLCLEDQQGKSEGQGQGQGPPPTPGGTGTPSASEAAPAPVKSLDSTQGSIAPGTAAPTPQAQAGQAGNAAAPPPSTAGGGGGVPNASDSKALIEATQRLLGRALNLRLQAFALIDRVKQESRRALLKTEDALARRTAELSVKKKCLETHQLDVEAAILVAERSLEKMQRRLDPKDKEKAAKLASDQKTLEELRKSRLALQEDIRNKFAALEIDNLCRRVTPAKADSAKRQANLSRTSSAPNIRVKKDMGSTFTAHPPACSRTACSTEIRTHPCRAYDNESLDGSTRAPSSMATSQSHGVKPGSPPGGSSALKAAGAQAAGLH